MDFGRENCTKSDGIRMKSEMKFREKLMRNETLRKRCDIKSDREKPYDSQDFLESPHRISTAKSLKNQSKTMPKRVRKNKCAKNRKVVPK